MHLDFERQRRAAGQAVDWRRMDWKQITTDFNTRFEGKILPGNLDGRPRRTKDSLRTERNRIKEIRDHTGIKPRDQKQPPEDSEDEEDEEVQPRPKYPRRGDPAPGKPPRRHSDDDDDSDFGGGALGARGSGIRA